VIVLRPEIFVMTDRPTPLASLDRADELPSAPVEVARLSTKFMLDKACPEPVEGRSRRASVQNDKQIETLH